MSDALASGASVTDLFVRDRGDDLGSLASRAEAQGAHVVEVDDRVLGALTETTTPQGVVARVEMPTYSLDAAISGATLVLVMDELRDPGNAGTLVRSAAGAEADAVIFSAASVDPFGPKTVRSAAGSLFRIPVVRDVQLDTAFAALAAAGLRVIATAARAQRAYDEIDLTVPAAIVVGNEARGVGGDVMEAVDDVVAIPLAEGAESLNAAVAGSIVLFEARRQRVRRAAAPE